MKKLSLLILFLFCLTLTQSFAGVVFAGDTFHVSVTAIEAINTSGVPDESVRLFKLSFTQSFTKYSIALYPAGSTAVWNSVEVSVSAGAGQSLDVSVYPTWFQQPLLENTTYTYIVTGISTAGVKDVVQGTFTTGAINTGTSSDNTTGSDTAGDAGSAGAGTAGSAGSAGSDSTATGAGGASTDTTTTTDTTDMIDTTVGVPAGGTTSVDDTTVGGTWNSGTDTDTTTTPVGSDATSSKTDTTKTQQTNETSTNTTTGSGSSSAGSSSNSSGATSGSSSSVAQSTQTSAELEETSETTGESSVSEAFSESLGGYILLQVEKNGEAWYVDPSSKSRFYLKDGSTAYTALRTFGLGITNTDLSAIPVGIANWFDDVDTDQDGLGDNLEIALGTDPSNADSDGDGYDDGTEIQNGFSPLGLGAIMHKDELIGRLKGKILLQVESHGEAWYVNPKDEKKYSVTFANALPLFENFALGITDTDLAKIPLAGSNEIGNLALRNRLKGWLLLQVEQKGAIWFIDQNGYRHSVTWNNLMDLFENLALGITDNDLNKIYYGGLE